MQYARVYRYSSLPMDVYAALMASASKGEYLCKNIAFEYPYEYLGIEVTWPRGITSASKFF